MSGSASRRIPPRQVLVPGAKHRIQPYLESDVHEMLVQYCIVKRVTVSAAVDAGLRQLFGEESNHTRLYKRLDRQSLILERVEQHLGVLGESFAVFVQCWFAVTPKLAGGGEGEEARRSGKARAKQFFRHVAQQFGCGGRFLSDLVREAVGSDAEPDTAMANAQYDQLAPIVESSEKSHG